MGLFDSSTQVKPVLLPGSKKVIKKVLNGVQSELGKGPSVFKGSTVTPFSKQTTSALSGFEALAGANMGGAGLSGHAQGILDNGGFNPGQMDAMSSVKDLTNNGLLNELIDSKNGFTGEQDKAYQGLQGAVYGNNASIQKDFNAGGFDAKQNAAYDALNNKVTGNNAVLQGTFDNGGLTDGMTEAMSGLKTTVLPNSAMWQQQIEQGGLTADQQAVQDRNRALMSDPFDVNANPAYAAVRERALKEAQMGLDAQAAKTGRYGGASSQTIAARERGNLATDMDLNEYRSWQNRGDQAARDLFAGGQTGTANKTALAGAQQTGLAALAGLGKSGLDNQLGINSAQQVGLEKVVGAGQAAQGNKLAQNSAIQGGYNNIVDTGSKGVTQNSNAIAQKAALEAQLFNMNQAGLDNMGKAYETAQMPMNTLRGVGREYENLYAQKTADDLRKFQEGNKLNWLSQAMQIANGAPTGQTTTTSPSWANLIGGGALGLAALGSGMGWFGNGSSATGGA